MFKSFDRKWLHFLIVSILLIQFVYVPSANALTVKEEEELANEVMVMIRKNYQLIEDPQIIKYLYEVGNNIVEVLPPQPFTFKFHIIKEDVYNAFALPAGHIFVNSGLFEAMDNEDQLAGLLAHEISHVVCRHISQKMERDKKIGLATLAGITAAVFLGAGGAATAANALFAGTLAAGQSASLAYSRDDEMQADQLGLKYLTDAGYGGEGLLNILKKIRSKQWFGSDQVPTYLTTHPAVEDRIAYLDSWTSNSPIDPQKHRKVDPRKFKRAKIRLSALYGDESSTYDKFKAAVQKKPLDQMAHYGLGLILARKGQYQDAIAELKKTLEISAFDPFMLKELGRLYFVDKQYDKAINALNSALGLLPNDAQAIFYLARTYLDLNKPQKAISLFEKLLVIDPNYPQALYYTGETYDKIGKVADSHYYLGLHYRHIGNLRNAMFHLRKAYEKYDDADKKKEIEEMLHNIEKLAKQLEPSRER